MAFGATLSAQVDSPSERKSRGAFFTPPEMADALCSWAIRASSDRVLDPACGEAVFLLSAMRVLRKLGVSTGRLSKQIVGCELHRASANAAIERCEKESFAPNMHVGDFLETSPDPSFDAVVGNPPYVRFQSIGARQQRAIREIASRSQVQISALSSSWVPFVLHAASFLKTGGRLAYVLPAELLSVNYAAPVRAFLLNSFSEVTLAIFEERVFPEVQEEVVLLFASGYKKGATDHVTLRSCKSMRDFSSSRAVLFYPQGAGGRWSAALTRQSSGAFLDDLEGRGFAVWASGGGFASALSPAITTTSPFRTTRWPSWDFPSRT